MDHRTNLELEPVWLRCVACSGPVRFALAPPFRIDLATGRIHTARRGGSLARTVGGDVCETCRLDRARGTDEVDGLALHLEDLQRVHADLDLGEFPGTFQRFDWMVTEHYPELRGCALRAYGIWCQSPRPLPELTMRSLSFDVSDGESFSILFPLEVLSHPDIPVPIYSRWDPRSGREWEETDRSSASDPSHVDRLRRALDLTWQSRSPGRPRGTTVHIRGDYERAFREATATLGRPPKSLPEFLAETELSPDTVKRNFRRWGTTWTAFRREQLGA